MHVCVKMYLIFKDWKQKQSPAYLYYLVGHRSWPHKQTNPTKNQGHSPCHYKSKCNFGFIKSHDC